MGTMLPPKPTYVADGSGRDTYIRRDPQEQHGKNLYKPKSVTVTRFGASGCRLPSDRHTGYAGFHPGERDNSVGGRNPVISERPARFLPDKPDGETYPSLAPLSISKYTTIKELTIDAFSKPPANGARSNHRSHISGFSGFVPRAPLSTDPHAVHWTGLTINREQMLRDMFAAMDLNSDGKVTKEEMAKLCEAALIDPDSEAVKGAFLAADFSGSAGGGDGSLSVEEVIIWNLERSAGLSDEQFEEWIRYSMEALSKVWPSESAPAPSPAQ
ncbi:hypothetical protein AB1Y20_015666 [Prymnesium parvum]|uniref:EF-hand domain-containing protein n=1 Tax=Prymnesium parvum TaxID=97485 RepID=A0AB34K167_PRYPA